MDALLEFLASIAAHLLPEWIKHNVSPRNQIWATLGCTFAMLVVVALAVVLFVMR